jgi:hypothetical protein
LHPHWGETSSHGIAHVPPLLELDEDDEEDAEDDDEAAPPPAPPDEPPLPSPPMPPMPPFPDELDADELEEESALDAPAPSPPSPSVEEPVAHAARDKSPHVATAISTNHRVFNVHLARGDEGRTFESVNLTRARERFQFSASDLVNTMRCRSGPA